MPLGCSVKTHSSLPSVRRSGARWRWQRGCACDYWTTARAPRSVPGRYCERSDPCRYTFRKGDRSDTSVS